MSAKLRRSLTLALLTVSFGFAGTQIPASAAAAAPAATEPPPTEPRTCSTSVLFLVQVDPCSVVGSLQELAAYGAEDAAKELGMDALKGVNLANVCTHSAHPTPPPASIVNACPIFGG